MTEPLTTEGLDVPDALELIAKWERGNGVEWSSIDNLPNIIHWMDQDRCDGFYDTKNRIYRQTPAKPRLGKLRYESDSGYVTECKDPRKDLVCVDAIELTPEVRAILEREGLL